MLPDWLRDPAINALVSLLALIVAILNLVSSDRGEKFVKRIFLFLGRSIIGIFVMGIRIFFASLIMDSIQNKIDLTLIWQKYFSNISILGILIIFPGVLTAVIASSGVNWREVIKRSAISAIIIVFISNVLTSSIDFSLLWLSVEILTSLVAGLTIAFLLRSFGLWIYQGIVFYRYA